VKRFTDINSLTKYFLTQQTTENKNMLTYLKKTSSWSTVETKLNATSCLFLIQKKNEHELHLAETRILRWTTGQINNNTSENKIFNMKPK